MKRRFGWITLCAGALLLSACQGDSPYFGRIHARNQQVLTIGNGDEPRSLDPHKTNGVSEGNIIMSMFEGLTGFDPKTLDPVPALATSWESLDNGTRWIFHLRTDARWTDGHPLTAHDFVYSWRRGVDPKTACPYAPLFLYIKNAEAITEGKLAPDQLGVSASDDHTLEVLMERTCFFFDKVTLRYPMAALPQWAVERHGDDWTKPENIVTSGPFRLIEHRPQDQIVLARNSSYYDASNVKLDRLVFLPVRDFATIANLYKAGEIDVIMSGALPTPMLRVLSKKKDYLGGKFFATYFLWFNTKKRPFNNVWVRQAFNAAIDKDAIATKLMGVGETPATSLVPPGASGYPRVDGPPYDPQEAARLLAKAGYPDGLGFPSVTISINPSSVTRQIAEAVQRMLKQALMIDVAIQQEDNQTFQERVQSRQFSIARNAWIGDYLDPISFLDIFAADSEGNSSGWSDDHFREMLFKANAESERTKRLEMLADAERYLLSQMPVLPVYFYTNKVLCKPYVKGYYSNLLDTHPLKYVWIDPQWSRHDAAATPPRN